MKFHSNQADMFRQVCLVFRDLQQRVVAAEDRAPSRADIQRFVEDFDRASDARVFAEMHRPSPEMLLAILSFLQNIASTDEASVKRLHRFVNLFGDDIRAAVMFREAKHARALAHACRAFFYRHVVTEFAGTAVPCDELYRDFAALFPKEAPWYVDCNTFACGVLKAQ